VEGIIAVSVDLSNTPSPRQSPVIIYLLPLRSISPARRTHSSSRVLLKHIPRDTVVKRTRPPRAYTFSRLYHYSSRIDDGDRSHTPSLLLTQTRELYMTARGRKKVSLNRRTFISRLITHARIVIRSREWLRRRYPDITHRPSV
jgi:hypothetical protein